MGATESKFIAIPFRRRQAGSGAPAIPITAETMAHAIQRADMTLLDYLPEMNLSSTSDSDSDKVNVALCCESTGYRALWLVLDKDPTCVQLRKVDAWLRGCTKHPEIPKAPLERQLYVLSGRYWMFDIDKVTKDEKLDVRIPREAMIKSLLGNRCSMRETDIAVLCAILGGEAVCKSTLRKFDTSNLAADGTCVHLLVRDATSHSVDVADANKALTIDVHAVSMRTFVHNHICGNQLTSYDIQPFESLYADCKRSMRWCPGGSCQSTLTASK